MLWYAAMVRHTSDDGQSADLDFRSTDSRGLQIVSILVSQIGGAITLARGPDTRLEVAFSEANG